ncbi:MAG: rhodanese-like domain-containing protein [Bacteroidetes bacterium]|nr:rhodanese-like domain-containing protein [Bacteroidota bacterium]
MLQTFKSLLGLGPKTDFSELIAQGAIILDVRSKSEFANGHIRNAINIPVNELSSQLTTLKDKNKCIVCCCASGMRSGMAKRILESNKFTNVYNAGSWMSLQHKI